jgi:hypothetical protein
LKPAPAGCGVASDDDDDDDDVEIVAFAPSADDLAGFEVTLRRRLVRRRGPRRSANGVIRWMAPFAVLVPRVA